MDQLELPLNIAVDAEVDGVEMGVLSDGTAYLSGRGLGRVCGVDNSSIFKESKAWEAGDRTSRLALALTRMGIARPKLFIPTTKAGVAVNAYPEDVCMAFLEYYAFEARLIVPVAVKNYRVLARAGMRFFIYKATGYDPAARALAHWKKFHDRLLLNPVPPGHFSVFREMSALVVEAIQGGLVVDEHTVPDVSIELLWSKHWGAEDLDVHYGPRRKHPHEYPEYFPQARANETIEAWIYPLSALGEFRLWIERTYLPEKFPKYLESKVKKGTLPAAAATHILERLHVLDLPAASP